jgi:16S rRNA (guanine527-N7)-methyltransferase
MHADAPPAEPGHPPDAALWQALGWQPQPRQLQQLCQLQQLLRSWNQRLNLTRLVEGDDYWIAQVFDSLWPLVPLLHAQEGAPAPPAPDEPASQTEGSATEEAAGSASGAGFIVAPAAGSGLRIIDVGTGGGFPGLAVAIALPGARITLVDSVQRKLDAVAAMAAELGLADRVLVRSERVERTGRQAACRGRFQLAMARAVAAAPVVAEYLVPLLAPNGQALLYRGQWTTGDQQELERALLPLSARIERCDHRELPAGRGLRTVLSVVPTATCPATFPRAIGVPAKLPLGQSAPAGGSTARRSSSRRPGGA